MADAIGMVETVGFVGVVEAGDAMSKAAQVALIGWDKIGGGLVAVFCEGDVAAVKSAVDAGAQAASKVGAVHSVHAIARPHPDLDSVLPTKPEENGVPVQALGLVETRGATGVIEAADAMSKAADVEVVKIAEIGGGYVTVLVTGDVGSVKSAVRAGSEAAEKVGELAGQHVIPRPADDAASLYLS